MKHFIILVFILTSTCPYAQSSNKSEENAIKETIEIFFQSLEQQDSLLLVKSCEMDGQIWRVNHFNTPYKVDMRFIHEDVQSFDLTKTLVETALSYDIQIHRGLAMAWVPYMFYINGEFSHCGVDVFILVKKQDAWKITSAAYTVEKDGCEELKKLN